ncbi:hypothetical protein GOP47_0029408 [Adiantum capillus-veneris]|nr:hypothetical protein GOP47_0029408 [Adiantum capillus-veneris]
MSTDQHVVVFPWPEQGHINPALVIALFLVESGIHVTFVHTQRSYAAIQQSSPLLAIPLMKVEVVPDIDPDIWRHPAATEQGFDLLLSKLMQSHPSPSCLLVDTFFPWSHSLAARYRLPRAQIWTASAYAFTVGLYVPELIARGYLPVSHPGTGLDKVVDFIPGLTPFRMANCPAMLAVSDLDDFRFKFFASVLDHSKDADRVLAHTVYDIEHEVVDALRESSGICMDPIGPLVTDARHCLLPEDSMSISWLDKQEKASVLYIAFGSVFTMKYEDLVELAYGLAASGQLFFWVVRPDSYAVEKQPDEKLQEAFNLLKKQEKGYITSWAPQLAVLQHPSVGGFLSHCGWNSTFESLHLGVPILGFPLGGEQPINLKCIVNDWKAGLALQEAEDRGKPLGRDGIEKAVRGILAGEEGKRAREGALKWSKLSHNAVVGSSRNNLQKFVNDIIQGRLKVCTLNQNE